MKLKKNGFLYQWTMLFREKEEWNEPRDLCSTLRHTLLWSPAKVVAGAFVSLMLSYLFIIAPLCAVAYGLLTWDWSIFWNGEYGTSLLATSILITYAFLISAVLVIIFIGSIKSLTDYNPVRTPPVLREAYRSIKDKYCPLIEWSDD